MFGEQEDELVESLKKFWESEGVRITPEDQLLSVDKRKPEIYYDGCSYKIGLPWKEDFQLSTNSYQLSKTQLRSLHFKFEKGSRIIEGLWQNYSRTRADRNF